MRRTQVDSWIQCRCALAVFFVSFTACEVQHNTPGRASSNKTQDAREIGEKIMPEHLWRDYTDASTPRDARRAQRALIAHLKERHPTIGDRAKDTHARDVERRFSRIMKEWNPVHFTVEDLITLAGTPTTQTPDSVEYVFDNGLDGCVWSFGLAPNTGTIRSVRYIPGE